MPARECWHGVASLSGSAFVFAISPACAPEPPLRVRAFSVVELVDFHRDGAALDDPALTVGFPEPPAAARTVLVEHLREVVRPAPQRMTFGVPYGVRDLVGLLDGAHAHRVR